MASRQEEHYHAQAYKSPGPSYMQFSAWLGVWEGQRSLACLVVSDMLV